MFFYKNKCLPGPSRKKKKPSYRKRAEKSLAELANRHVLYQQSVQCVEAEIDMIDENFKKLRGRQATSLREDFCGTANTSCEWVRRRPKNIAVAIDLDQEVVAGPQLRRAPTGRAESGGLVGNLLHDPLRARFGLL